MATMLEKEFCKVAEAIAILQTLADEFTRKDYDAVRVRGSYTMQTLEEKGIVKVVRRETFEIENKHGKSEAIKVMVDKDGKELCLASEYKYDKTLRSVLTKLNGGVEPTEKTIIRVKTITGTRNIYAIDEDKYNKYIVRKYAKLCEKIDELNKEIVELTDKVRTLTALKDSIPIDEELELWDED